MLLHRNAKLGLAGRLALVPAIEAGLSQRGAAARFSVSPRPRTAGGGAGARQRARSARRSAACSTAAAGRTARHAS